MQDFYLLVYSFIKTLCLNKLFQYKIIRIRKPPAVLWPSGNYLPILKHLPDKSPLCML